MTFSVRRVRALVAKDFRIHGRDIALTQLGLLGLLALMEYLQNPEPSVTASAVFNFNFLLAGFWSEWLISREKAKATFAWLRACPVDDLELVAAKFAAVAICCITLWSLSSVLFLGDYLVRSRPAVWVVLQAALLTFGALAVATRWRLGPKLGQMLPFGLAGAAVGVLVLFARAGTVLPVDPEVLLRSAAGQALLGAVLIAGYAAIFAAIYRWVRTADTSALLE